MTKNTAYPDGCECDLCQNWDTLNRQRNALSTTNPTNVVPVEEIEKAIADFPYPALIISRLQLLINKAKGV